MLLLHGSPNERTKALDSAGRPHPLVAVVSAVLAYVKDEALNFLRHATPTPVTADQVRWVVTVPAVWSDEARSFMRLAAHRAGCVRGSIRLIIPLGGECVRASWRLQVDHRARVHAPDAGPGARVRLPCHGG